jgi:class 3 adenylate cyclase
VLPLASTYKIGGTTADGDAIMIERPLGTVTFLFTDIEASARCWEETPEEMRVALARHDIVLREAIENCGGWLVKHTGDGVIAVFTSAGSALWRNVASSCLSEWAYAPERSRPQTETISVQR